MSASTVVQDDCRPIVGILSVPCDEHCPAGNRGYVAASYVKYLEASGFQVVLIPHFWNESSILDISSKVSALLWTGGNDGDDAWFSATAITLRVSQQRDIPLIAICLGFERLLELFAENNDCLDNDLNTIDVMLPLKWTDDLYRSEFAQLASIGRQSVVFRQLASLPLTYHYHFKGMRLSNYSKFKKLEEKSRILATSKYAGNEFISMVESKQGNFILGLQFHPEKISYEWNPNLKISHFPEAIESNRYFSDFLMTKVRSQQNCVNGFPSFPEESEYIVYKNDPVFSGIDPSTQTGHFTQIYYLK